MSTSPDYPTAPDPAPDRVPEEVLVARAYLSRVADPPAPALVSFVAAHGPVEAARRVRHGAVPDDVAAETAPRRVIDRAVADLAAARSVGARLVTPEHAEWPTSLFADDAAPATARPDTGRPVPPVALWVLGTASLHESIARADAATGSRLATGYGVHVAGQLGVDLAAAAVTVISGAALGVDGAAHRGALAAVGLTCAVLPCGIGRAHPAAHEILLHRVTKNGALVSECPPGAVPAWHRFLARARLIALLAAGTVVVEVGVRSTALATAAATVALRRPLLAVPGPVTSLTSAGCHRLIRQGATLATGAQDVLDVLDGGDVPAGRDVPTGPGRPISAPSGPGAVTR